MPATWHAPRWWLAQAMCIHNGTDWRTGKKDIYVNGHLFTGEGPWNANTGNGYYGGMQFLLSTWASAGGVIRPDLATPREQLYRAWVVYRRDGNSWREWGTAGRCGLR